MKTTKYYIYVVALLICSLLSSCKPKPVVLIEAPHWEVKPTVCPVAPDWQINESITESTISMNMIVSVPGGLNKADKLAALYDGECIGTVTPVNTSFGLRFYLCINKPIGPQQLITLAYYSDSLHTLSYWVECVEFINDNVIGMAADPYLLEPEKASICQYSLLFHYQMPKGTTLSENDELALFCGDRCRAVLPIERGQSTDKIYATEIPMQDVIEDVYIRYYSVADNKIYNSRKYTFHYGSVIELALPLEWE